MSALLYPDGRPVPTPEQWEAAVTLAQYCRACDMRHGSLDVICPPPPAPVIAPCPYCGDTSTVVAWDLDNKKKAVSCVMRSDSCSYLGPIRATEPEAISAHNDVAERLKVEEPKPRTCGGCKYFGWWMSAPSCTNMSGYGDGQDEVTNSPLANDRDASCCERWEPRS